MKKRILIVYATYGSGHKAIAKYINNYFLNKDSELEIKLIDMISYSKKLGKLSKSISENLMLKHPIIWDALFKWADHKYTSHFTNRVSLKWFDKNALKKDIMEFNPDLTISTHFYGSCIITDFNKEKVIKSKLITVITDYEAHDLWLDHYNKEEYIVVPSKEERHTLLKRKIDRNHIKTFGIPIFPKEEDLSKKEQILDKLKLNKHIPTCVCFAGGGNGSTATMPYIKGVLKSNQNINLIFIAGNNKKAYDKINSLVEKYDTRNCLIYGFVDNVPELLQASDFVVTKPGGAQTTECLYFKKPMLLIKSSGGQENYNISYFVKKGYARIFKTPRAIYKYFNNLERNYADIERMKNKLSKSDNKDAMKNLYDLAKDILKNSVKNQ
ncbi:MAG: hypothetical protein IJO33_03815 [Bacilli bacterium]|nr:hypothetical protein [Bacilli bacterium]